MQDDNNRQQKKPFKVTISDEDYSRPDELDELKNQARRQPPAAPLRGFRLLLQRADLRCI